MRMSNITIAGIVLLGSGGVLLAVGTWAPRTSPTPPKTAGPPAEPIPLLPELLGDPDHPEDPNCSASGCGAIPDDTPELTHAGLEELLAAYSAERADVPSEPLENILFHFESARAHITADPSLLEGLPIDHAAILQRELRRDTARVEIDVIDEHGILRLHLDQRGWPIGHKHHVLVHESAAIQPPEASGTVKRVGLHHLWTRM